MSDPAAGPSPQPEPEVPSEEEVAAEVAVELEEIEERRYPSTVGGMFYLLVLVATLVGLVLVAVSDWRVGIRVVAGAILSAALARLVLPQRDAGMLAVRHRVVDCAILAAVGGVLVFLSVTIPDQPV